MYSIVVGGSSPSLALEIDCSCSQGRRGDIQFIPHSGPKLYYYVNPANTYVGIVRALHMKFTVGLDVLVPCVRIQKAKRAL